MVVGSLGEARFVEPRLWGCHVWVVGVFWTSSLLPSCLVVGGLGWHETRDARFVEPRLWGSRVQVVGVFGDTRGEVRRTSSLRPPCFVVGVLGDTRLEAR